MPDEEFDALFRQGLEHYPEQPEDPAAWHGMELLLDADLRQQALRRRVWRLLGAEAVLLVLGVWATFFILLEKIPLNASQLPLATTGRAAVSTSPTSGTGRILTATASRGRATESSIPPMPTASLGKQSVVAATEASRLADQASSSANKLSVASKSTPRTQATSSTAAVALIRSNATARTHKSSNKAAAEQPIYRRGTLLAAATSRSQRTRSTSTIDKQTAAEKNATASNQSAKKDHKLALSHGKRRLHQSVEASAQELTAAASRHKALPYTVAYTSEKAAHKASRSLSPGHRRAATAAQLASDRAAALANEALANQAIDPLAPRWPVSGLHFQLPDSLALLALPLARPIDSLNQPKPRPLLSAYRFRLGLVGAPEFSTVRADRLSKPGSSLGVMLEYQLGRRWRVSAGYLYTNKLYVARGTDYTLPAGYTLPHGYVISNVDAACRIVDIPLNLRYDLWQRPRYQLFISAGLSSLLMRREQYTYDYELLYGKPVAPYSWELDNGSQHVLKVLNLSAGYERAVGQRWTVQAEPFVKLPLAGVGFGAVRLSSAGVFFSLKYGLLPVHPAPAPR